MKDSMNFLNARDFGAVGSEFCTAAKSTAGSFDFEVESAGDFKVGNEVLVKGALPHIENATLFERKDMSTQNPRRWKHNRPLLDRVEIDGYDGTQGEWVVYFIDMWPESPDAFRWSNNFGIEWHDGVPYSDGWIEIDRGIKIKINEFAEREWGCTAVFVCSSRMVSTIEKIDGNVITLSDAAGACANCELMHSDSSAIQRAIDAAIEKKTSVFLPNGKYRLTKTLMIKDADGFTFEGENAQETVLDDSLGAVGIERLEGSCFCLDGGEDVTLKNFSMIGCYGFADKARGVNLFCHGGSAIYGFYFQKSNATCIIDTKRVLIENCHARKMSAECFYSMGTSRELATPSDKYTRSITYLRCSVEDCARNAFNNNDKAEGTSILHCRIKDVGNAAWEGASRFVKIHGCYISNTGAIAIGNIRRRADYLNKLGTAQHIITDNYFESGTQDHTVAMIKVGSFASQVVVKGNVFVNFNSPAIYVRGDGQSVDTPPEDVIISGNSIDLTAVDAPSAERYGINISSNFVTVSDNHIYVRGQVDENVRGIIVSDDVTRLSIHDNTIAGCSVGIKSERVSGVVGIVVDDKTFYRAEKSLGIALKPMLLRVGSHRYKGWKLHWLSDGTESEIADFDPEKLTFELKDSRKMATGDEFYIYGPTALPWLIHHNIIDNCGEALSLDTYAGKRARLDGNVF